MPLRSRTFSDSTGERQRHRELVVRRARHALVRSVHAMVHPTPVTTR